MIGIGKIGSIGLGKAGGASTPPPIQLDPPTGHFIEDLSTGDSVRVHWTDPSPVPYGIQVNLYLATDSSLVTSQTIPEAIFEADFNGLSSGFEYYAELYNIGDPPQSYTSSATVQTNSAVVT